MMLWDAGDVLSDELNVVIARPFVLHLLRTDPGGFGGLIKSPEYFFLAVVYVIAAVLIAFLVCSVATRLQTRGGDPAHRRRALRAWMGAVVSCFAATAILLSISTWIAMNWLQDKDNIVTTDPLSLMLNSSDGWRFWLSGYLQALVAVLIVSVIIRWRARGRNAAEMENAEEVPTPNLLLVALVGFVVLEVSMFLTRFGGWGA